MDNEEKFNQGSADKSPRRDDNNGSVRYRKVNVYTGGENAFDRDASRSAYRGGTYNRNEGRGYRSYRENNFRNEDYRQGNGSWQRSSANDGYSRQYNSYENTERPSRGYQRGYQRDKYSDGGYRAADGYSRSDERNYRYAGGEQPRSYGGDQPRNYGERSERRSGRYEYQGRRPGSYGAPRPQRRGGYDGYNPDAKYCMRKRIQYAEVNFDPEAPIRLNKFLANAGVCSRRDADKYITAGVVTVNGEVVTELGTKIKLSDQVRFNNETVSLEKKVYVLLNKPKDYVTTSDDPQNRKTVMDLVRNACRERIYPVGRLDRNTTGVLLLTNDGELASKLTHPKYKKKKIYHAFLDKNVSAVDMQQIANGVMLEDGEVHADAIEYASITDKKQVGIEIHSGKNRIVRRIFESLGYHVTKLDRVYFAGLTKKNLKRGQWRFLTQDEVNYLKMGEFE